MPSVTCGNVRDATFLLLIVEGVEILVVNLTESEKYVLRNPSAPQEPVVGVETVLPRTLPIDLEGGKQEHGTKSR